MKKSIFQFCFIFLFLPSWAVCQATGSISGKVISAQTGSPLSAVTVTLSDTHFGAKSNTDGYFDINEIPEGTYFLRVSYIGYESQSERITIEKGGAKRLKIMLSPKTTQLNNIVVKGRAADLVGIASSASQGQVAQAQLQTRPLLRTGEILETVPGMIVTQHSGPGKANQYFIRGFNLDHGTDFALSVEGVPVNLPTHAHGQGYLDINFLIPELIDVIQFRKGPYYADAGDFSTTGNAQISLKDSLKEGMGKLGIGMEGYRRAFVANSWTLGKGNLLAALNYKHFDGPWVLPDKSNLFSGVIKYGQGNRENGYSITAMGYHNKWHATDQIPQRAVKEGLIPRFGAIDSTDGGLSNRYTASGNWWHTTPNGGMLKATAYVNYYDLDLFSNFTYFMDHPDKGDQLEQADKRIYAGGQFSYLWFVKNLGQKSSFTTGLNLRHDQIFQVGLFNTQARRRFNTISDDKVGETDLGVYFQNKTQWSDKFKTILGVRGNWYQFDVTAEEPINSGKKSTFIASPKVRLVFGPWSGTEFYADFGLGYHSNDARGTTLHKDPISGDPLTPVNPLVRTRGAEVGVRTNAVKGLQSTLALWYVGLNSELVFDGDAGGTEASGASTHYGLEWSNYYQVNDWLAINADLSLTKSYFNGQPKGANSIENSIGRIISGGITAGEDKGFFGSLRLRYFGPRPLNEEADPESMATAIFNFKGGYRFKHIEMVVEILNIFDDKAPDISYFYESRLRDEPAPVEDIHLHPTLPRAGRFIVSYHF